MAAYVIGINKRVTDAGGWTAYLSAAATTFPDHVRPIAKFGTHESLEGEPIEGLAIFEFPSYQMAVDWYHSESYQKAIAHRLDAADFTIYVVEGTTRD
jgi:uncharacterized protein (DUF1330 family)